MRTPELDIVLGSMLDTHPGISDLVFAVDRPFQVESFGELKERGHRPAFGAQIDALPDRATRLDHRRQPAPSPSGSGQARCLRLQLCLAGSRALPRQHFPPGAGTSRSSCGKRRPRCPACSSLGLSPIFRDMSKEKNGLILVTGATGSGKTTTAERDLE